MKKSLRVLLAVILIISLSSGCVTSKEQSGALTGAAVGAAVGSAIGSDHNQAFAIWLGAVVGASIGSTIGRYMDEQDRLKTGNALETQRTHTPTTWVNPDTQNTYTVTPTRTYTVAEGPCREFTLDAQIGGKTEQIYGTACRQSDGSWKVIK
jgi:surface antigen